MINGEGIEQIMKSMFQLSKFEENSLKYLEIIDIFYKEFKQVQDCSVEITKIVNIYLYNFIEKNNKVNFNAQFYVKIFNFFVYNQTFINVPIGLYCLEIHKLLSAVLQPEQVYPAEVPESLPHHPEHITIPGDQQGRQETQEEQAETVGSAPVASLPPGGRDPPEWQQEGQEEEGQGG